MDFTSQNLRNPVWVFRFVAMNNPAAVKARMQKMGYNPALYSSTEDLVDFLTSLYSSNYDVSSLINVPYINSVGNETGGLLGRNAGRDPNVSGPPLEDGSFETQGNSNDGFGDTYTGELLMNIGTGIGIGVGNLISNLFGGHTSSGTQATPLPTNDKILGIDSNLFYVIVSVLGILTLIGVVYLLRKKGKK